MESLRGLCLADHLPVVTLHTEVRCGATTSNSLSNSSRAIHGWHVSVHGHVHVPCVLLLQGKFLVRSRLAL